MAHRLIRLGLSSRAELCIVPLQDVLHLGKEARMNTPRHRGRAQLGVASGRLDGNRTESGFAAAGNFGPPRLKGVRYAG